ncbi:MAG: outer membrane lipoprotein-sorting protein [Halioglobus sp.]
MTRSGLISIFMRTGASAIACLCMAFTAWSATPDSPASSAAERGLEIAREADHRNAGFGDSTAELSMFLQLSPDEEIERSMRQLTLEVADDGDKSIMVFDRPRDLNGTAILTFTHKVGTDDQWLYLPALKRVKRISSADQSGPFMGSEFAYEDLASQEVEKYRYRYLGDETLDGAVCFVVERVPVDPKSGYSRLVTWIDQDEYRLRRIDYYDRKGDLLKTMTLQGYRQYLNAYWRADEMLMINHQSNKRTRLVFSNYRFRTGLTDQDFSRAALSRMR